MTSKRYEQIKSLITDIYFDYNINSFPIDIFAVAEKMQIGIRRYDSHIIEEQIILLAASNDGMSYYSLDDNKYHIAYNPCRNIERIRFTIAHEIGHIVLGHKSSSDITEKEADIFAQWFLVPEAILIYKKIHNAGYVSNMFGVSLQCAEVCLNKLIPRIKNWKFSIFPNEKELLKQFGYEVGGDVN